MRRIVMVAAGLAMTLVAGCQDGNEASPPPTSEDALTTATGTPPDEVAETSGPAPSTAEPDETTGATAEPTADGAPEMPPEAMELSEEGAAAFTMHFFDVFNHAYAAGNPHELRAISAADCVSCTALEGLLQEPSDVTDYITLLEQEALLSGPTARVETDMRQRSTSSSEQQRGTMVFDLEWVDNSWEIAEITVSADS